MIQDIARLLGQSPPPQLDNARYAKTSGPYRTDLTPLQAYLFQAWLKENQQSPGVRSFSPTNPQSDYDMRGYWRETNGAPVQGTGHFPDTWKTPYHQSFSGESVYATPQAGEWKDTPGGGSALIRQGIPIFRENAQGRPINPLEGLR